MATSRLILVILLLVVAPSVGCQERPEAKYARLVREAEAHAEKEQLEESRISLQSAIAIKPEIAESYFKLAEVLLRLKRFPEALENYRTALNRDPEHRAARLHLAALMIVMRQYEQAESDIRKVLEKSPQDFEARVLSANLERARGKTDDARRILSTLLKERPKDVSVLATLGDLELADNHPDQAEAFFREAIAVAPDNETVRVALADLYAAQGRDDEARVLLTDVLKVHRKNTTLRLYFAEFLLGRGETGKAREQFELMLKTEPALRDTRDRLYDMYLVSKEPDKARQLATDLKKVAPDDASIPYFEGRNLELDNKQAEALVLYQKTTSVLSNFGPAFRRAGLVQLALGQVAPGLENLNHAIVINPLDVSARLALARSAFLRRDFGEAQGHVAKILERYPRHLAANVLRTDILLLEGKTEEARRLLDVLTALLPNEPVTLLKRGLLEEQEGKTGAAIDAYERFLSADFDVYVGAARLARLYVKRDGVDHAIEQLNSFLDKSKRSKGSLAFVIGSVLLSRGTASDLARAHDLLEQAVSLNPEISQAYAALAQIDMAQGNLSDALARYQQLLARNPKHISALMLTGLTYERMGKYSDAEKAYRSILSFASDFAPAKNNLAWLLADKLNGNLDEAFTLAQQAKETLPQEAGVADTLGWVCHKRGQSRAASTFLEEAIDLANASRGEQGIDPDILYHLGVVRLALGEDTAGRQALQQALERGGRGWSHASEVQQLLGK